MHSAPLLVCVHLKDGWYAEVKCTTVWPSTTKHLGALASPAVNTVLASCVAWLDVVRVASSLARAEAAAFRAQLDTVSSELQAATLDRLASRRATDQQAAHVATLRQALAAFAEANAAHFATRKDGKQELVQKGQTRFEDGTLVQAARPWCHQTTSKELICESAPAVHLADDTSITFEFSIDGQVHPTDSNFINFPCNAEYELLYTTKIKARICKGDEKGPWSELMKLVND